MGASKPWGPRTHPLEAAATPFAFESGDAASLSAADVLLVDPCETTRERLRTLLERSGYSVTTACHGVDALNSLRSRFVPLLITDVAMPEMGGLALCRALRSASLPSHLYKIVLSQSDGPEDFVNGLAAGADAFISKHATTSAVLAMLAVGRRIVGQDQALRRAVIENSMLADTDELTGSGNRRYLMRGLGRELAVSAQRGQWLSVLMCDLDHFKPVNDRFGHRVGDEILQAFVARVQDIVSAYGGWIGRYGGEEFVVVLAGSTLGEARTVARHIRLAVAASPLMSSAGALALTVSIGVTGVGPVDLREVVAVGDLLERADDCMYLSKAHGRDTITARRFHATSLAPPGPARSLRAHAD